MSVISTALGTKVAIAALSLVAIGGGTAAFAAGGVLPVVASSQTDDPTTAAPTSDETSDPTDAPTGTPSPTHGPDATGPAAFGLCTAFTAGGLAASSVAYANLLSASEAAGGVEAYCAPILAAHSDAAHGHVPSPSPSVESGAPTDPGSASADHRPAGSHGH